MIKYKSFMIFQIKTFVRFKVDLVIIIIIPPMLEKRNTQNKSK